MILQTGREYENSDTSVLKHYNQIYLLAFDINKLSINNLDYGRTPALYW